MSGAKSEFSKSDLKIINDAPDPDSNLFNFDIMSDQLEDIITDSDLSTPFVIGIDGEWGSGKTTLLTKTYNSIQKVGNPSWKLIWFNAWKYEKYDPVFALYHSIIKELKDAPQQIKDILQNVAEVSLDAFTRKATGMSIQEIAGHFEDSLNHMKTLDSELENAIGKENRLIVFIDDLDRCDNDKILEILFNIKEVLNAKNTVFILGIDMKKIERAWDIKHKGYEKAVLEGKDHADKLFQLKIQLPRKEMGQVRQFINSYVQLPTNLQRLLAGSIRSNPRKAKLTLNTMYFVSKSVKSEEKFQEFFPSIVISSIMYNCYKDIMEITKESPESLFRAAFVCHDASYYDGFKSDFSVLTTNFGPDGKDTSVRPWTALLSPDIVTLYCYNILKLVLQDPDAFDFLKLLADYKGMGSDYSSVTSDTAILHQVITQMPFLQ